MATETSFPVLAGGAFVPGIFVENLAPPFFGYAFNLLLAGMLIVQVYIYYLAFDGDSWTTKMTVYSVFVLELTQTALQISDNYQTNVQHWGDSTTLDDQHLDWFSIPIITAMTAAIVQSSFGLRIKVLSNSLVWPSMVWFLAVVQLAAGLAQGILSAPLAVHDLFHKTKPTVILWGVSTALNDVLIAVLLAFYLTRMKSAFETTNTIVTRIVSLIVGTGALTAVWAIVIVLLYFLSPQEFGLFTSVMSKCYSNSLMVMLNQRIDLRDQAKKTLNTFRESEATREDTTFHLTTIPTSPHVAGEILDSWEVYQRATAGGAIGKRGVIGVPRNSESTGEDASGRKFTGVAV
ncbi:hypothetical protein DL96DRAFT_1631189 [Flagelloscypha sp. PMI_526]|nr:hypothetical protein DL96DRAFT_1631189 [Flagelloscypha sp. PMI_526]